MNDANSGEPAFEERSALEVLAGAGRYTVCINEPPWSAIAPHVPAPVRVIDASNMDIDHLEGLLVDDPDSDTVVGLGGGSAMDTAKFLAWKNGKRLVLIPSITSVDAAFTDAVGVRVQRKVRYVGRIAPDLVVLDVDLVRSAPARFNRAGVGDILSCHTALWDWQYAVTRGKGVGWDVEAASLGVVSIRGETSEIRLRTSSRVDRSAACKACISACDLAIANSSP